MNAKEINKEQLILEAAEIEFLEKGYNMAKTTDIAKRAGVTHAMLHYYFRTKENLFNMIFQKKSEIFANSFLVSFGSDMPFMDKIKKGVEDHFDVIAANPKLPGFIFYEIINNEERRKKLLSIISSKAAGIVAKLKKDLEEEISKGTIRPIEPYDLILNVISLNAFVFITSPIVIDVLNMRNEDYNNFLIHRKQNNVDIMLSQLRI